MNSDKPVTFCPMCGETVAREDFVCPCCGEGLQTPEPSQAPLELSASQLQLLQKFRRQTGILSIVWMMLSAVLVGPSVTTLIVVLRDFSAVELWSFPSGILYIAAVFGTAVGIAVLLLGFGSRARKSWSVPVSVLMSYVLLGISLVFGDVLLIVLVGGLVFLAHACLGTSWQLQEAGIPLDHRD